MIISILTLFPEMFTGPFDYSIIKRARDKNLIKVNIINIRDFSQDKYKTVDDRPFGGGIGMIMKVDVIDRALCFTKEKNPNLITKTILLDARGKMYNQETVRNFSKLEHLIIICGHYEGVDHRVTQLVDEVVSIGNYVLTGGELPAMTIVDSITRLLPSVLKPDATIDESFTTNSTAAPQYTRPENFQGLKVPEVLLSGNHKKIEDWKKLNSKKILPE